MPGPTVPYQQIAAGAGDTSNALQIERLNKIIQMVDGAQGVSLNKDVFEVNELVLDTLRPGDRDLVTAAVARANVDPLVALDRKQTVSGAGFDFDEKKIKETAKKLGWAKEVVERFKTLFEGASAKTNWWGVTITLTQDAGSALAQLVGPDLMGSLGMLAPFVPQAAAVLAVVAVVGMVLSEWINNSNGKNGVVVKLVMWVVPWVESNEEKK